MFEFGIMVAISQSNWVASLENKLLNEHILVFLKRYLV